MPPPPAPPAVEHGHSHGLVDASIKRSREGLRAVALSLAILLATALLRALIYLSTSSAALLADLIHNFGDALTAVPLGAAFLMRSVRAERWVGLEAADPVIGLAIAVVILRITWQSFQTVRGHHHHHDPAAEGG